jgi:hypothetical protein
MSSTDMTAMETGRKADGEVQTYQPSRPERQAGANIALDSGKQGNELEIRNPAGGQSDS